MKVAVAMSYGDDTVECVAASVDAAVRAFRQRSTGSTVSVVSVEAGPNENRPCTFVMSAIDTWVIEEWEVCD